MFTQYLEDQPQGPTLGSILRLLMFTLGSYCFIPLWRKNISGGLHRTSHGTAVVPASSVEALGAGFADARAEKGGPIKDGL